MQKPDRSAPSRAPAHAGGHAHTREALAGSYALAREARGEGAAADLVRLFLSARTQGTLKGLPRLAAFL